MQRLPKISITYSPFESNNSRLGGYCLKCLKYDSLYDERGCFLPLSDQDLYDFIEPNPVEDPALSECDGQQSTVSCIKVKMEAFLFRDKRLVRSENRVVLNGCSSVCVFQELEKVLNMSHQCKDKDSWKEESGWVQQSHLVPLMLMHTIVFCFFSTLIQYKMIMDSTSSEINTSEEEHCAAAAALQYIFKHFVSDRKKTCPEAFSSKCVKVADCPSQSERQFKTTLDDSESWADSGNSRLFCGDEESVQIFSEFEQDCVQCLNLWVRRENSNHFFPKFLPVLIRNSW